MVKLETDKKSKYFICILLDKTVLIAEFIFKADFYSTCNIYPVIKHFMSIKQFPLYSIQPRFKKTQTAATNHVVCFQLIKQRIQVSQLFYEGKRMRVNKFILLRSRRVKFILQNLLTKSIVCKITIVKFIVANVTRIVIQMRSIFFLFLRKF